VAEHLPSKCKALGSTYSTAEEKKKKKKTGNGKVGGGSIVVTKLSLFV
jgi:hypothetical protein